MPRKPAKPAAARSKKPPVKLVPETLGGTPVAAPTRHPLKPLHDVCRSLPGVTEDMKWGHNLVFSVGGKMFALFDAEGPASYAFKCDEADFDRLPDREGIIPAPYMARLGWVKVNKPAALRKPEAEALLRKAHALIAAGLSKKKQAELKLTPKP